MHFQQIGIIYRTKQTIYGRRPVVTNLIAIRCEKFEARIAKIKSTCGTLKKLLKPTVVIFSYISRLRNDWIGNGFCQYDIDSPVICHKWCEIDLNCEFNYPSFRKHDQTNRIRGKWAGQHRSPEIGGGIQHPDIYVKNNINWYLNNNLNVNIHFVQLFFIYKCLI